MGDLISIIIPVYNVEKYLIECLESVLGQSYTRFEAILIDDGSKDESGKICDIYAEKDSRFIVVHKENGGVSEARNVALDMAKGKYIMFLDSDDILPTDSLNILYEEAIENDSDIVISGWNDFKEDKIVCRCRKKKEVLDGKKVMRYFLEEEYFQSVIWSKLYLKTLIGQKRFDKNIVIAEDFEFLYRVLKDAKKASINTTKVVYYYRIRNDSAMRKKYDSKFENEIKLTENVLEDVKKNLPELKDAAIRRYQRINVSCIDKYFRENLNIDGVNHLVKNIKKYKINLSFKHHIKMILLLHCRWGLRITYKILKKI